MVRYYGLFSNASRGKIRKKKALPPHPPIIEEEQPFISSKGWAEMIRKVYETDPLLCPRCGGQMKVIVSGAGLILTLTTFAFQTSQLYKYRAKK